MAKEKIQWIRAKAFLKYMHPFEYKLHLRKRIIRWPAGLGDKATKYTEVWSETFHCWLPVSYGRVYRIYDLIDVPNIS